MNAHPDTLSTAVRFHQAGDLQQALQLYRQILELTPNHPDALHLLGVLARQTGKHEIAKDLIGRAIKSNPFIAHFHTNLGNVYRVQGKLDQAVSSYTRAVELRPDNDQAHFCLGNTLRDQGKLESAVASYQRALQLKPDFAEAHNNLGTALRQLGRTSAAIASYQRALELMPNCAESHTNLGSAHSEVRRWNRAVASFRRALELKPNCVRTMVKLGAALRCKGNPDEALACFEHALRVEPRSAEAHRNMGVTLAAQGQLAEAMVSYQRALEINPDHAEAHCGLGVALKQQRRLDEAIASYRRALSCKPNYADAHNNLGNALAEQGKLLYAVASYQQALELVPEFSEAYNNLGNALKNQGRLDDAISNYRRALKINSEYAEAHLNLGNALKEQGKLDAALDSYTRALDLKPAYAKAGSGLLLLQSYLPSGTPAHLFDMHARWDRQHAEPLKTSRRALTNGPIRERKLRLGFVSPDFGRHPVGYFFVRCLEALGSEECETTCYSDRVRRDATTVRIAAAAGNWREVMGLTDEALCKQIRRDEIDVLFDLSGHTAGNRLLMFARKPAPVQVSWIGYVGTTGVEAIDYLFADHHHTPEATDQHYQEKIVRLPNIRFCYDPPIEAPAVVPLPAEAAGHVTFGSFNNPAKVTPDVIAVWAKILGRVPRSRLILKYAGLDDPDTSQRYRQRFADYGVAPTRIELRGRSPYDRMLAEYNRIDIALDPFPFSGAATSCEALWMGAPVVTCPFETFASRQTLGILSCIGAAETIASDLDHYVELAVDLAKDSRRLRDLRTNMRQRLLDSPLCDGPLFAAHFMQAVRTIWHTWCDRQSASS